MRDSPAKCARCHRWMKYDPKGNKKYRTRRASGLVCTKCNPCPTHKEKTFPCPYCLEHWTPHPSEYGYA